jgi:hypothetical protein
MHGRADSAEEKIARTWCADLHKPEGCRIRPNLYFNEQMEGDACGRNCFGGGHGRLNVDWDGHVGAFQAVK